MNIKGFGRLCDADKSRKIRPLFSNRKRKTDRETTSETRTDATSSFPVKKKMQSKQWAKKNIQIRFERNFLFKFMFLPFYQT